MHGMRWIGALSRRRSSRRPHPLWIAAFVLLPLGIPSAARAHNDPPGCSATGAVLEVRVFRDDGVTDVIGAVAENEDITYQAVLRKSSSGACAFSGGTLTLTLPDGTVETISSDVPCIGGTTSPCIAGLDDLTSPLFDYTASLADVSGGVLTATADYTGGVVHDSEPDTPGVSATTPKQTPVGLCTGSLCASDPPGCSATGVSIDVRLFRGDGVTGVCSAVSECENLYYQAVLTKSSDGGCALSGGTFTLILPNGTIETISNDVPCIGGTSSPCVAGNDALTSPLFEYTVSFADVSGGALTVTADYTDGVAHDTNPGTPGVSATAPKQTPVVLCTDNNACTDDVCDSTQAGAAACSHIDVPVCGTTTTTTINATTTTTLVPAAIDRFECYKTKALRMAPIHVTLSNELETKGVAALKVDTTCVPIDKNGEGIPDPSTYLTCYRIKQDSRQPRLTPQSLTLTDQFGTKRLIVVTGRTLCVPSTKTQ